MRAFNRIFIATTFLLSIWVIYESVVVLGLDKIEAVALFAAALAVIASVFSSWSAQRTLEMQEDALKPYPYPFIDTTSRPGTTLFRLRNFGSTTAHDIQLIWDQSKAFEFHQPEGEPDVKVLMPGEAISFNFPMIDSEEYQNQNYSGFVKFKNASGRELKHKFVVSLGQHTHSERIDSIEAYASMSIQDLPRMLSNIDATVSHNLSELKRLVEQYLKHT